MLARAGVDITGLRGKPLCRVLLGQRQGAPEAEALVDKAAKKFLAKAWAARGPVNRAVNAVLGTKYEVRASMAR